jgi:hypothetical protein
MCVTEERGQQMGRYSLKMNSGWVFWVYYVIVIVFLPICQANAQEETVRYSLDNGGLQLYQSQNKDVKMTLGGEVMARYEHWNWFEAPANHNEYDYWFERTRLNLKLDSKHMVVFVQPQYVHMFSLPDNAVAPSPQGPLGMGGLYYMHNQEKYPYKFGIHQAYLQFQNILDQDISLKVGQFEYSDGLEAVSKADGKKFNILKEMRLSDRLISSFDWSAFGRAFDGGLFNYGNDKIGFSSSFFYPTEGGWEKDFDEIMEDIKITTATLTVRRGVLIPGAEVAGFYYYYKDNRDVTQRADNSGITTSVDGVDIDIHMAGGRLLGVYDLGPGQLDILFWGGAQFGDWYGLDQRAYAADGEAGYQFTKIPWKPWLRIGYYYGSGDDDPSDGNHGTFFQMAPGTRKYELLPFCDLMNTQDLFVQLIAKPVDKLTLRTEYHYIQLSESNDRWYMGSGPTQEKGSIFGYIARPSNGKDSLAQEIDLITTYNFNPHCNLVLSYSHVFGGDVISNIYSVSDGADYFSLEMQLKF